MKHSLQLKLSQHLTLTPQLQQSIRLLQLSTVELNQELERYLAENPLLERTDLAGGEGEPASPPPPNGQSAEGEAQPTAADDRRDEQPSLNEERSAFDDEPSQLAGSSSRRDDDERDDFTQFAAAEPSLQEHLLQQISLTGLTPRDKLIAEFVIGHLDEDGYLKQDLEELRESAAASEPGWGPWLTGRPAARAGPGPSWAGRPGPWSAGPSGTSRTRRRRRPRRRGPTPPPTRR